MRTLNPHRATALAAAVGAALAIGAPAAAAADTTAAVSSGGTTLTLNASTAKALRTNGITVSVVGPARAATSGAVLFPIAPKGSRLDPATYAGTLNHTGGLRFRAGGKSLRLTNFRVNVGASSTLSARLNSGRRATIVSLSLATAKVSRDGLNTGTTGIVATLNKTGASALNRYFGVTLFRAGLKLGSIASGAQFSQVVLAGGTTELDLDIGALAALVLLGFGADIVAPGTLNGITASLPITGGTIDSTKLAGSITHSGGLSLTAGGIKVTLTDFDIQVPAMLGKANGAAPAALFDVDTSGVGFNVTGSTVTVSNVVVKVSAVGAKTLNEAFNTTAFSVGGKLGVATIKAQAR